MEERIRPKSYDDEAPDPSVANSSMATDRVAGVAHETIDRIAEQAGRAEGDLRAGASHAMENARELEEKAMKAADEGVQTVRSYVARNPLAGIGIAFIGGMLLSALLRR